MSSRSIQHDGGCERTVVDLVNHGIEQVVVEKVERQRVVSGADAQTAENSDECDTLHFVVGCVSFESNG